MLLYTIIAAAGDAAAKHVAQDYAAPQLFALSGGLVAFFALASSLRKGGVSELKTDYPIQMAVRSAATLTSAILFFIAMRSLPLAEIFVFVGMMPIMAALLSPMVLNETVSRGAWVALLAGFIGVLCLFPEGIVGISQAHFIAAFASFFGVISMVLARYIGQREQKSLALLFYPHMLMFLVMAATLPFVFKTMPLVDLTIACIYSLLLFAGRYLLVKALSIAPAHIVMPVINVQFIWMVFLGIGVFAEHPALNVYLGAAIVILSSIKLIADASEAVPAPEVQRSNALSYHTPQNRVVRSKNLSRIHKNSTRSGYRSQNARRSVPR